MVRIHLGRPGRVWGGDRTTLKGRVAGSRLYINSYDRDLYGRTTSFTFKGGDGGGIDWRDALVAGAVIVGLAVLFDDDDGGGKPADEQTRREFQDSIDAFARAAERYDIEAIEQQVPAGYTYKDVSGTEYDREQFIMMLRQREEVLLYPEIRMELEKLTVKPKSATGIVAVAIRGELQGAGDRAHEYESAETHRVYWEKEADEWVLRSARQLKIDLKLDGQEVTGYDPLG